MFFTISGFLISTLLLREKQKKGTINYKHFLIRRFLRLLPVLILFYATICLLILTNQLHISWAALLISVFYGYNFVPNRLYYSELGHTWSLAVEEQFYFLWPWVVLFFKKYGLLLVALLLLLLAIIALIQLPTLRLSFNGKAYFVGESFHADRFFLPAIAPIMIGSIAAVFHFFYAHRAARFCISTLGKLLIAITATAAFWLPAFLQPYLFILHALCFALVLGFIYVKQQGTLTTILEWQPLAFTGKISYGIYVWQGLFLGTGPGGKLWIQQPVQNICLTWLVAICCYYLVEVKVLALKKHFIA
jgi:peptidoglycan/LPS O-acetylase OafA/YrhL